MYFALKLVQQDKDACCEDTWRQAHACLSRDIGVSGWAYERCITLTLLREKSRRAGPPPPPAKSIRNFGPFGGRHVVHIVNLIIRTTFARRIEITDDSGGLITFIWGPTCLSYRLVPLGTCRNRALYFVSEEYVWIKNKKIFVKHS